MINLLVNPTRSLRGVPPYPVPPHEQPPVLSRTRPVVPVAPSRYSGTCPHP